ncbi:MAG TPA: hypothetical protein VEV44_16065 [Pseudoneobacillus sp.]|nr:hypothetical protein [Pseudoneobacillus sp.]
MGCCSPNYRTTVNEQEDQVNQKASRETLPLFGKIAMIMVVVGGIIIAYLTY